MLMAAGLGTRLRPFTDAEPKALLPLLGVPMAQFALDQLARAGVSRVVANVHHHAERAKSGLEALDRGGTELLLSDESELLLGSAGGIRKALPLLGDGPFFLVNADVLCDAELAALAECHARLRARHGVHLTLTVFPAGPSGGKYRELFLDRQSGLITGFGELAEGRPFFVGAAILEPEALREVPPQGPAEFVPAILEPAIRDRKAGVFLSSGIWHDVGSPGLWLKAHAELIRALETRALPAWRERIESVNKRIAPGIWISRRSRTHVPAAQWAGPAYWNPLRDETAHAPRELGPDMVVYGSCPRDSGLSRAICYRGLWAGL